jgi:hypothetical protein
VRRRVQHLWFTRRWAPLFVSVLLGAVIFCCMTQLNPVEKIWRHMKAVVTANRLYGSMAALVDAANVFFEQLSPSGVQALAA